MNEHHENTDAHDSTIHLLDALTGNLGKGEPRVRRLMSEAREFCRRAYLEPDAEEGMKHLEMVLDRVIGVQCAMSAWTPKD